MHKFGKIFGINVLIFIVYVAFIFFRARLGYDHSYVGLDSLFAIFALYCLQFLANIILAIVMFTKRKTETGKSYFLTSGIMSLFAGYIFMFTC